MGHEHFIIRSFCELCQSRDTTALCATDFTEPTIFTFLKRYFGSEVFLEYTSGVKYEVLQCNVCGFIWQKNILNRQLTEIMYNSWAPPEPSFQFQFNSPTRYFSSLANESSLIALLLKKNPVDIRVLDFGMGWGERALSAKAFGYDSFGMEISKKRIEFAESHGIKSFLDSDPIDQTFHFITSYGVIDQVSEPIKTVKRLSKILERGGILKISTMNSKWLPEKFKHGKWDSSMQEAIPLFNPNCFTSSTLKTLGKLCGLKKVKALRIFNALSLGLLQGSTNLRFIARNLLKHSVGTRSGLEVFFEKR